jgi:ubiquinone/menaquinone biosynthesis C-methylase UbiE
MINFMSNIPHKAKQKAQKITRAYTKKTTLGDLSPQEIIGIVYELVLHRKADPDGAALWLSKMKDSGVTAAQLVEWMYASGEWWTATQFSELSASLHFSRSIFVRSLPPAKQILDVGGTAIGSAEGAMVIMGYPYKFDKLTIVDLPFEDRDPLYKEKHKRSVTKTPLGPVQYNYHSMTDLSKYQDNSFDLVYSGQSIEHVPLKEADKVLKEIFRVLRPGGYLGIDTPNGTVCRVHQKEFINPDHDYEYTHDEMVKKLTSKGFKILESKGLNYAGESMKKRKFSLQEVATKRGLFADIENCYLLAYLCQKPKK